MREEWRHYWWPETLLYACSFFTPFEIFSRSQSAEYFINLLTIFNIKNKTSIDELIEAFRNKRIDIPKWSGFNTISPSELIGYEKLSTLA
jgi:hypothetical protein